MIGTPSAQSPVGALSTFSLDALRKVISTAAATPAGGYRLAVAPVVADLLEGAMKAALDDASQHVGQLVLMREAERRPDRFEVMLGSGS